ncbi:MAG: PorP/SprF family type IX secretion system membrane protein [Chitinophagales bacterium]|nr:PorP/SprF family type IX secretion system membrane protein [Chitinophagales bacterium]
MKKLFFAVSLNIISVLLMAQDPHWSQFYIMPQTLNPALIGAFNGNYRLSGIFRGQWNEVLRNESVPLFRTYSFAVDFRTNRAFGKNDAFGFGAFYTGDKAGELKFGTNSGGLGIAYHKSLDRRGNHFLALGVQSEIFNRVIDYSQIKTGSQWDGSAYNPNLPPGEFLVDDNFLFWDISTGLMWYGRFNKRLNAYAGFSAFHLNRPSVSFLNVDTVRLNMKFVGHAGVRFPLKGRFDLQPKFIYMNQGQSHELIAAADVRILFEERFPEGNNFRIGAMFRAVGGDTKAVWGGEKGGRLLNEEAVIITAGVDWSGLSLGVAYDINVSELIAGSRAQGAFEIGLSYAGSWKKRKPQTIFCPRF